MTTNSETRATLLERLRDPNSALAWRDFFERYWRAVFGYARRRGCSDHTADEVVQEVMLTVFEQRGVFRYDPARGRFRNWLGRVVGQKVALKRRRDARRPRAVGGEDHNPAEALPANDRPPDEAWDTAFESTLLFGLLEAVRTEVAPETYQAFELTMLHDLDGADVARLTGLSRNAVYLARKRVLRRLQELGSPYRDSGELQERLRNLIETLPTPRVERNTARAVETTMLTAERRQS